MMDIDKKLLFVLANSGRDYLTEDFLEEFLSKYGMSLEEWEHKTRAFYWAGEVNGKRIWKPVSKSLLEKAKVQPKEEKTKKETKPEPKKEVKQETKKEVKKEEPKKTETKKEEPKKEEKPKIKAIITPSEVGFKGLMESLRVTKKFAGLDDKSIKDVFKQYEVEYLTKEQYETLIKDFPEVKDYFVQEGEYYRFNYEYVPLKK